MAIRQVVVGVVVEEGEVAWGTLGGEQKRREAAEKPENENDSEPCCVMLSARKRREGT